MSVSINPLQNGIHSLAEALKFFNEFHNDPKNAYSLKNSIMYSYHALESLFKSILFSINPILLVSKNTKVDEVADAYGKWINGMNATVLDDLHTIDLNETLSRLEKYSLMVGINQDDYKRFRGAAEALRVYRNRIEHYALTVDANEVSRILGALLPMAVDIVDITLPKAVDIIQKTLPTFFANIFLVPNEAVGLVKNQLRMFPKTDEILDLLRREYDILIRQSIEFFTDKTFNKQRFDVKVRDSGKDTPPYMPELQTEGFLNLNFGLREISDYGYKFRWYTQDTVKNALPYRAAVTIMRLKDRERPLANGSYGTHLGTGKLDFNAIMFFDGAEGVLKLADADEEIRVLTLMSIQMNINLIYEAEAHISRAHYQLEKLVGCTGRESIIIRTVPKGFKREEKELTGHYEVDLNQKNTHLQFHAFLEPNGDFKPLQTLNLNIDTVSDLTFD